MGFSDTIGTPLRRPSVFAGLQQRQHVRVASAIRLGPWGYNIQARAELVGHLSKLSFRLVTPSTGNQSLGKTSLRLFYQGLEDLLEAPHVTSLYYYFASIMKLSSSYLTSLI